MGDPKQPNLDIDVVRRWRIEAARGEPVFVRDARVVALADMILAQHDPIPLGCVAPRRCGHCTRWFDQVDEGRCPRCDQRGRDPQLEVGRW